MSDVIRAIDFAVANRARFNLRVINLSIGAPVLESYETDPLTLAARQRRRGRDRRGRGGRQLRQEPDDEIQYGGVTAPGNAPWVLTVGAYSHMGTPTPDDRVAGYSSRGPTDVRLLPPSPIRSRRARASSRSTTTTAHWRLRNPEDLVAGAGGPAYPIPHAQRHQHGRAGGQRRRRTDAAGQPRADAQRRKAVLQDMATVAPNVDALGQGAGFLNGDAAVRWRGSMRSRAPGDSYAVDGNWSRQIIWGNYRVAAACCSRGDRPGARTSSGDPPARTSSGAQRARTSSGVRPRTTSSGVRSKDNIIWGSSKDNIIWGPSKDNIIWGSSNDNIIWGSNVVWGLACAGRDCENIIWGSVDPGENIIWGSAATTSSGDRVPTTSSGARARQHHLGSGDDNIIWGSGGDNIIWGSSLVSVTAWLANRAGKPLRFGAGAPQDSRHMDDNGTPLGNEATVSWPDLPPELPCATGAGCRPAERARRRACAKWRHAMPPRCSRCSSPTRLLR